MTPTTDQQPEGMEQAEHTTEWTLHFVTANSEHELTFDAMDDAVEAMGTLPENTGAMIAKVVTTYYLPPDKLAEYRQFVAKEEAGQ